MMKKILYFLPAIVFGLVYLLLIVENAGSIEPHGWFILALMIVSGILLAKKNGGLQYRVYVLVYSLFTQD